MKRARSKTRFQPPRKCLKHAHVVPDPPLPLELVRYEVLRACGTLSRHAARTATQLARTCRQFYYDTPWRTWVYELDDERTGQLTPETIAPWGPVLRRFIYRLPCRHDPSMDGPGGIVRVCPALEHLALIGNRCGSRMVWESDIASTLVSLYIGQYYSLYWGLRHVEEKQLFPRLQSIVFERGGDGRVIRDFTQEQDFISYFVDDASPMIRERVSVTVVCTHPDYYLNEDNIRSDH